MLKKICQTLIICTLAAMLPASYAYAVSYDGEEVEPNGNGEYEIEGEDGDVITLVGTGSILQEVEITLDGDADATVTVTATTTRPDDAPTAPDGAVYIYFDIDGDDLNSAMQQAVIRFSVTKEWLNENNITSDNVSLYHYTGGQWVELPTQVVSETSTAYNYAATTTSFSVFAAAGSSSSTAGTGENLFAYLTGAAGLILLGLALMPRIILQKK